MIIGEPNKSYLLKIQNDQISIRGGNNVNALDVYDENSIYIKVKLGDCEPGEVYRENENTIS